MDFIKTKIDGVVIVEPKVFGDHRGFFMESYSKREFEKAGLFYDFVQDNHSMSTVKGTLRGIHFQQGDKAQAKLVRCARGGVLDVAVDLRSGSPTYKQWVAVELTEENKRQLLIPRGFGHGFRQGVTFVRMPVFLHFRQRTPECAVFIIAAAIMLVYHKICVTADEIPLAVIAVSRMPVQFQGIQSANRHPFPRRLLIAGIRMGMLRDLAFLFHGDGR